MRRVALVFPGAIDTPSGGYAYDRRVLAELSAIGWKTQLLGLAGSFPDPAAGDVAAALEALAATPPGTVLLVDGLALGGLTPDGLARLDRPLVALVHHPLALETGLAPADAARLERAERAALSVCGRVIAVSPHTRNALVARYGVPDGAVTIALPGSDPAPRAPADGAEPRLLSVGALVPRKGYDVLLDALATLRDLRWSATIAGSPGLDPATAAGLAARVAAWRGPPVRLAGALAAQALDAAYAGADIMVHPSHYEGYGMVLTEALRRGLPIVCTTGGASADTVPDAASLKVPPGDAAALAGALRRLLTDRALRRRLAAAAFAAGCRLPGWGETARTIAAVLDSMRSPRP